MNPYNNPFNPLPLQELRTIKRARDEERERKNLSISLGFCPICGCRIIDEPVEVLDPPKKYLWGLITYKTKTWDVRRVCPTDISHFEDKYNNSTYDLIVKFKNKKS